MSRMALSLRPPMNSCLLEENPVVHSCSLLSSCPTVGGTVASRCHLRRVYSCPGPNLIRRREKKSLDVSRLL